MYTQKHAHAQTNACLFAHVPACEHLSVDTLVYMHTRIHVYMHTCVLAESIGITRLRNWSGNMVVPDAPLWVAVESPLCKSNVVH